MLANNSDNLYLYYCDLRLANFDVNSLASLLNKTDSQRFLAYKNQLKKRQFVVARYLIKHALHKLFAVPIEHQYQLVNYQNWFVKQANRQFTVSISHSQDMVVIAVSAKHMCLGVDVEQHKARDFIELAKLFTTATELELLQRSNNKKYTFYRLWTAKEAYFKAQKSSDIELSQMDLSLSLCNDTTHLAEHYYYQQALGQNEYSLCLLSKVPIKGQAQSVTIDKYCLHDK
ncbi:4'-phosphopantetheinyl transferase superfamily protein [Paraglaciecola sp. L3A3]|uniref:4'-phosphopantetheinyl transferase family protein n=1 Tax=Paraglaciecola sp. L3A3 TaxID=2686358 RepID=UPI00131B1FC6|nr:4'-phosphopantetheinyl transferase superfamily protein [Paraglaciecola sp. L3A3]